MILHLDSDAAYLVVPKARSRVAGYFYCGQQYNKTIPPSTTLNECKTLKHAVASAAEGETAGLFHNCQTAVHIRKILTALYHLQPATPTKTDNSTASCFVNDTLKKKRSKAWDIRYHWLSDQSSLDNFFIYWDKGTNNYADYHTKYQTPTHHINSREKYVLKGFHVYTIGFTHNMYPLYSPFFPKVAPKLVKNLKISQYIYSKYILLQKYC